MIKITESEMEMIKRIAKSYCNTCVNDTDFYNAFGVDADKNKELRGTFGSLKRKKIVVASNERGFFNPIYPTAKFIEVCNQEGIELTESAIDDIKDYI